MTTLVLETTPGLGFGELARRALSFGRATRGAPAPAPVRRDSLEAGSFETLFFVTPARGETDRLLRVARAALDAGRKLKRQARVEERALTAAERLVCTLTAGAVRVLEELLTLSRLTGGRVYPSYGRLAQATGLGRATVARAIACLDAVGFLQRRRRFVRITGEGAGPRIAQTSNAYRLLLPAGISRFLPRWMRPAPLPTCEAQHQAERAGTHAAMLATLSCRELAATTTDGALGGALARLGATLDQQARESHGDPETQLPIIEQTRISGRAERNMMWKHLEPASQVGVAIPHRIELDIGSASKKQAHDGNGAGRNNRIPVSR